MRGRTHHFLQTILCVGFLLRELAGLLRKVVQLLRRVLMLHPVQDVASFLQTISCAPLPRGSLLGTAVLLALGALHVLGGFLQTIESLLQLRRSDGANAAGAARLSGLLAGLLSLLSLLTGLALLTRLALLSLLALLPLLPWLLLRRVATLQLLHLLLELFGLAPQHFLLPALLERLLLILLCG